MVDLDIVASYMTDFKVIVEARIESQKAAKKIAVAQENNVNNTISIPQQQIRNSTVKDTARTDSGKPFGVSTADI